MYATLALRYNTAMDHLWYSQLAAISGGLVMRPRGGRVNSEELTLSLLYVTGKCLERLRKVNAGGAGDLDTHGEAAKGLGK